MKTFKDLEFKPHDLSYLAEEGMKQAIMFFPNDYGVSVLFGWKFYSNGVDTYELAVLRKCENGKGYLVDCNTPITEDVLSYITEDEVTEAMIKVQKL